MTTPTKNARAEARRREREEQQQAAARRQRLLYAGVGAVVLLVAIGIAVVSVGETSQRELITVADIAGDPRFEGDPLPALPGGGTDPAIGMRAPVVTGADFDGTPVTLGDDAQVIAFLASWCPACDAELPEIVRWLDAGGPPEGVEFVAVSTQLAAERTNWPPTQWFADAGYDGTIIVDNADGEIFRTYGATATPTWVAVNADGEVVFRSAGMLDPAAFDVISNLTLTD
ncbi:MAG: TlpA family protein disulfide reductase [Nitriliruptoraceae bacterium]